MRFAEIGWVRAAGWREVGMMAADNAPCVVPEQLQQIFEKMPEGVSALRNKKEKLRARLAAAFDPFFGAASPSSSSESQNTPLCPWAASVEFV